MSTLSYLALGDSYTIGEKLPPAQSFPYQLQKFLAEKGVDLSEPMVIAQTGWTTDELMAAIRERQISEQFALVSLLIGVNNQYRGRSLADYVQEMQTLLPMALQFAGGDPRQVFVLSIPDWGVTPFAEGKDRQQIAAEIDAYNQKKKELAAGYGMHFMDITESTRAHGGPEDLVDDGLHPNGQEYGRWAQGLARLVHESIVSRSAS